MAQLLSLTSEHDEFGKIIQLIRNFASEHGVNSIERDEANNQKVHTLREAQAAFDQIVMHAIGEAPLFGLTETQGELERFSAKSPKASRSKIGNFVITTLIRAAFWQKRTIELCWMLGLEVIGDETKGQIEQYHGKIVANLTKEASRLKT